MRCSEARRLITARLSSELPDAGRADLEAHLSACPACREDAADACRTSALLGAVEDIEPSGRLQSRLRQAIRDEDTRAARWLAWWPIVPRLGWALALVAAIAVGGVVGRGLAEPSRVPVPVATAQVDDWSGVFGATSAETLSGAYLGAAIDERGGAL